MPLSHLPNVPVPREVTDAVVVNIEHGELEYNNAREGEA